MSATSDFWSLFAASNSDDSGTMPFPIFSREDTDHPSDGGKYEPQVLALYEELREALLRYLLGMCVPLSLAEEMVQDAFVMLQEHLEAGRPATNLRGWLFRVVHNLSRTARRARASSHLEIEPFAKVLADAHATPETQAMLTERQKLLLAALDSLPETERQCVHLRSEGLPYREIADVLGMSVSGVGQMIHRAIERIKEAVGEVR